jgi:hypothetical protein
MTMTPVPDVSAEEFDEFCRGVDALGPVQRRILALLIPRLIALEERGDTDGALRAVEEIRVILCEDAETCH